jgi:hypothetical protein
MKKLSLLLAVAFAAPAFAQTTTPATDAAATTTSYPPCSAQVTDQCKETPWTHGHHAHAPAHHKGHHPKK